MIRDQETSDFEIKLLLEAIFFKYSADFRSYSKSSLRRRLTLALNTLGVPTFSALQDRILSDQDSFDTVLQYLTVPTSELFRDPGYFHALRKEVLPILATYPSMKIWIAGCSTGEEIYSIAILLKEEGLLKRSILYATDINPKSLKAAQAGVFRMDEVKKAEARYVKAGGKVKFQDYFEQVDEEAIFSSDLRENVVFADHSLATDSVFAEVQLISCRNVLIYFNRDLQDRAFRLFRDSLSHRGFLGIGSRESMRFSETGKDFEDFIPHEKIYRKKAAS